MGCVDSMEDHKMFLDDAIKEMQGDIGTVIDAISKGARRMMGQNFFAQKDWVLSNAFLRI